MIVVSAPPLEAAEAARRASRGRQAFWLCRPVGTEDVTIGADVVGSDPVRLVRGSDVAELESAWADARRDWGGAGTEAPARIPIAAGFLSYDLGRRFERLPVRASVDHGFSDIEFHFHDAVWIRQPDGRATVAARDESAARRLLAILALPPAATAPSVSPAAPAPVALGRLHPEHPDHEHLAAIRRVKDFIVAGDVYQVNLARPLRAAIGDGDPRWLVERLRSESPAAHGFWMSCADGRSAIVGNSPELFLRVDGGGGIETRPIKGTRPRAADAAEDARLMAALRASEKDRAEHVMIVDLERSDLGRVCRAGSVGIEGLLRPVTLPTVHHLISTVHGRLQDGVGLAAILRATFPGGSVTGAPKIRAMEIIEELEPARRGPYTGATGWLGAAGDIELAVAIRTATVRDGNLRLWVGGGIVADSDPEDELRETEVKAAAFARILGAD